MHPATNNETSLAIVSTVVSFAAHQRAAMSSHAPSFLRGWTFLNVVESDDVESLSVKAVAEIEGPTIVINPSFVSTSFLEDAGAALVWLPIALNHLCTEMLHETDDSGLFRSDRWVQCRNTVCRHMHMGWDQILTGADTYGTNYMAEALASALFVESGLMDILISRKKRRIIC